MEFISAFSKFWKKQGSLGNNDDMVDRLHWKLTAGLFLVFALVISTKQYVGDPIDCWCPAQFTSNYVEFTESLCWVKNTYYVPMEADIPKDDDLKPQLVYYQWTPFILMLQVVLFLLPSFLWQTVVTHVGVSISDITQAGHMYTLASKRDTKQTTINYISKQLDHYLYLRRETWNASCKEKLFDIVAKRKGVYIATIYMVVKVLYLFNVFLQFFILNFLLGSDFESLGIKIIRALMRGEQVKDSAQFPRISLCDFTVRGMGSNRQTYTVECVLSINLFNEKIFVFIWFWLLFVATVTVLNILMWLTRFLPWLKLSKIKMYLKIMDAWGPCEDPEEKRLRKRKTRDFTCHYLRADGYFILRMLNMNSNDLVAAEVTYAMWNNFDQSRCRRKRRLFRTLTVTSAPEKTSALRLNM